MKSNKSIPIIFYGRLLGRQRKGGEAIRQAAIHLQANRPLTKAQVVYALETLLRWNGIIITLNDDHTFSVK
jgi:hypothetical protein